MILTIISVIIAFTVPKQWSMVMARERDKQTIFVMKQYARSIREWSQKNGGTLPTSMEQIKQAKNPRYVRGDGELEDPLTGKFDWILVPPTAVNQQGGIQPGGTGNPVDRTRPGRTVSVSGPTDPATNNPNAAGPSKLNAALSPKDYTGPFVGVRPPKTGKSFLAFNQAENYEEWVYTIYDVQNEINQRQASMTQK
ncbi:MAG TPA: hypothetical protein VMU84_09510 [Thermoanaerobaculia bacterium]|nr:hypothetical protein [Thermoanaerobaculia bacterium]